MATIDFTADHVRGTYAIVERGHGGRDIAVGLGLIAFDGLGGLTGRLSRNVPGARFGERDILELSGSGTYAVTPSGLVSASLGGGDDTLRLAVRTVGIEADGSLRVNELAMIGRDLDGASGCLMTGTATRHPDRSVFAASSLNGLYVGAAFADGGQSPAAGFGFVRYDGQGRFGETNMANIQGDTTTSRRFVDGADEGAYTLEADGFGSVGDGGVRILVTHAMVKDDITRVEAYAFIVQSLVPATGALFTGTVRRVGD